MSESLRLDEEWKSIGMSLAGPLSTVPMENEGTR